MDIEYINLIIGITALMTSFFSYLRHSSCCYGMLDIDMKKTPPVTPSESVPLIKSTQPINIPEIEKPKIKNWL